MEFHKNIKLSKEIKGFEEEPTPYAFLLGVFLGPFALMLIHSKAKASFLRAFAGWMIGLVLLILGLTFFVTLRDRRRAAEARGREEAEYAAILKQRALEQKRLQEREEKERQEAGEAERLAALRVVQDLRDQVIDLRWTLNSVLDGRKYPNFKPMQIRTIDSSHESLAKSGILSSIDPKANADTLVTLNKKLIEERNRLYARLSKLDDLREKREREEAERKKAARMPCVHCQGEGFLMETQTCEICGGTAQLTAEVECPTCEGNGKTEIAIKCSQCGGKGIDSTRCTRCRGTGYVKCSQCNGNGRIGVRMHKEGLRGTILTLRKRMVRCDNCNGNGKFPCPDCRVRCCSDCKGSGLIQQMRRCLKCRGRGRVLQKNVCTHCTKGKTKVKKECSECRGRGWT